MDVFIKPNKVVDILNFLQGHQQTTVTEATEMIEAMFIVPPPHHACTSSDIVWHFFKSLYPTKLSNSNIDSLGELIYQSEQALL